jgi:hypothetical protein
MNRTASSRDLTQEIGVCPLGPSRQTTHRKLTLSLAAAALFAGLTTSGALAFAGHATSGATSTFRSGMDPMTPCKVIYLSDKTGAADYLYMSGSPYTSYVPLPQMPAVDNGWGLYATKSVIYAGAAPNAINVYKPCGSALGFSLTTAGLGAPLSIAADYSGDVYATEYGTSTIDWFSGATDHPTTTDTPRSPGLPYYLAIDNVGNVYTSGWDPTNTFEQIDICTPHMASCSFCEAVPSPSWPGGVALDGSQHLIVNNEIGSLWVYNAGCGTLDTSYVYSASASPTHFSFTDITLATGENFIWGAKQFDAPQTACPTPYCMDAQAVHYNPTFGTLGVIAPAKHTPVISGDGPGGGIAVWPPGPV